MIPLFLALALGLGPASVRSQTDATPGPGKFFFMWPTQVSQCQLVNLTWGAGAVAPFQAWVVPIGQQPFIYQIPASAYSNNQGFYQIQVQLNQGTNYVMLMSDARGVGSGGTSALQIVSSSPDTSCLNTASRNQTAKAFSYSVAGRAQQCSNGFEIAWDGSSANAPYNFTVIPLTQRYYPFDVVLEQKSGWSTDWVVNMTTGTRFTVVMNNKNGYGRGGAAGIYEVANTNNTPSSCVSQSIMGTGAWPIGVATNTLPVATRPAQTLAYGNSGGGGDNGFGAAIAGIVVGCLAALVIAGVTIWFCLRRRRRLRMGLDARGNKRKAEEVDLADEIDDGDTDGQGYSDAQVGMPVVSPYPTSASGGGGRYSAVPGEERRGSFGVSEGGTMTSAGVAGVGAAAGVGGRGSMGEDRERERERWEGNGVAGPLPSKSPLGPGSSAAGTSTAVSPHQLSPPVSRTGGSNDSVPSLKRDTQNMLGLPPGAGAGIGLGDGIGGGGGMRVMNHDHPDYLPAIPVGAGGSGNSRGSGNRQSREDRQPQFRRHADAGRVEDVVDLPPLYTDVPREGRLEHEVDVGERTGLAPDSPRYTGR